MAFVLLVTILAVKPWNAVIDLRFNN